MTAPFVPPTVPTPSPFLGDGTPTAKLSKAASSKRNFPDWLTAFLDYASYGEAPTRMYFWAGASAIAACLRRRVWIDQFYFRWYPNMYVVFVAPPGIVSKSTTVSVAYNLARKVQGVKFGPDVVTWQALVEAFAGSMEEFPYQEAYHPMSALSIESSEFGNLLNPSDKDMVDLLVSLWDGKQGTFEKKTKTSGNDTVVNPWINLIACTTPAWIAGNFPDYLIGGGFTSRCVFVYAEQKKQLNAYPGLTVPSHLRGMEELLVADLQHIADLLCGEYTLTPEAVEWGRKWYANHYAHKPIELDDDRFGGYLARKQTHIHKLAMILAASSSDELVIEQETLQTAAELLTDLEPDMTKVFEKIGKSEASVNIDRLINLVQKLGEVEYKQAYRFVHSTFPSIHEFQAVLEGAVRSGQILLKTKGSDIFLTRPRLGDAG